VDGRGRIAHGHFRAADLCLAGCPPPSTIPTGHLTGYFARRISGPEGSVDDQEGLESDPVGGATTQIDNATTTIHHTTPVLYWKGYFIIIILIKANVGSHKFVLFCVLLH